MAYENTSVVDLTFRAENIMTEPYVVVVLGTNADEVDLPDAVTNDPFGVIQAAAAAAGLSVPVRVAGVTKVVANGAFSKGDMLAIAATTGRVDTTPGLDSSFNAGTATAQRPLLIALEAANGAGEIVSALIRPFYFPWG